MQIYLHHNNTQIGPYTEEQLRAMVASGQITPDKSAWYEGLESWVPLNQIIRFDTAPKSSSKKTAWIVAAILLLLLGGGGAAWHFLYFNRAPAPQVVAAATPAPVVVTPAPTPVPTPPPAPLPPPPPPEPAMNPAAPDFGPAVMIFDPSMPADVLQSRMDALAAQQQSDEFSHGRYAVLFKPGKYSTAVKVGYYMDVRGLGPSPEAVSIGGLTSNSSLAGGNVTCAFWRSAENLTVRGNECQWAVSQGTSLRRVYVRANLSLFISGWSSGGFTADCKVGGRVISGSQQQWLSRNCTMDGWSNGVWNMVFVGCVGAPTSGWPTDTYTPIAKTPLIAEKPYLFVDGTGNYFVSVPPVRKDSAGITWESGAAASPAVPQAPAAAPQPPAAPQPAAALQPSATSATSISIVLFYIAHAGKDTAATINAALAAGKNLIVTPGIYHLEAPINVTRPGTVVLGLGYPTLVPDAGTPAMTIADVDGVRLGGFLFQAGAKNSPALLQVGDPGSKESHAANPVILYDIFARVGGAEAGMTETMVTINSNDTITDNTWLWRADHGAGHGWNEAKNKNGIVVNGANVICYGLAVEHTQEYQTLWNGENGRVYFYQSEIPYDVPSQKGWRADNSRGYSSYKVGDKVTTHEAWGMGVYSLFMEGQCVLGSAYEVPAVPGIRLHHLTSINFGGNAGGDSGIAHVVNNTGSPVQSGSNFLRTTLDEWPVGPAR